jgi:outer membrane immunogenic protein
MGSASVEFVMKRVIVASIGVFAFGLTTPKAADISARPAPYAPPPPVYAPPSFSWTGFYLGGNIGGAWAHRDETDTFFGTNVNNGNNDGVFIGGGQVGYNWQVGNAVLGVEADFDGVANNNNTGTVFIPALGPVLVTSNNRWITTVAARFGLTNGYWLFYGKAGGGWVGNEDFTVTNLTTGSSFSISNDNSNGGWLVGAGIEWAFAPNWSAKVEYNYLGLEDRTFSVSAGSPFFPGDTFTRGDRNVQMVKAGMNYRFNWGGLAEDRVEPRYLAANTRLGNATSDTIRTRNSKYLGALKQTIVGGGLLARKGERSGDALAAARAEESNPSLLGQYGDWGVYTASRGGNKHCFALAEPKTTKMEPAGRTRGASYLFVSTRPAEKVKNEVSVIIGYPFKSNSDATAEIGATKFAMYTQNDGAWIKNIAEEARMVDAMRKGADLTVKGTSSRGTQSIDQYSLKGLAQALDKIEQECTK